MTPIFPDYGGCVTGGFFLRCAWLRFWQQATHAILSRFALRIHVLSGVVGGLTPCFLTVVKNVYFVQKWRFENAYFAQNQAFEIVCFVHFMS